MPKRKTLLLKKYFTVQHRISDLRTSTTLISEFRSVLKYAIVEYELAYIS